MRRLGILLLLSLTIFAGPSAARAAGLPLFVGCHAEAFIADTQLVTAQGGQYLKVAFEVDVPTQALIWGQTAHRQRPDGFSAERATAMVFVEDAFGSPVGSPGGFLNYPYGLEATTTFASATLPGPGLCGQSAGANEYTLDPGTYEAIVVSASESGSEHGVVLPSDVTVTSVERGASVRLSERDLSCDERLRITAGGVTSERLSGCRATMTAHGKAYRALTVGHFPDADHQVRWIDPSGQTTAPVVFFDLAVGGAGGWTLDVPRYVTPLAHPFLLPVAGAPESDSGIFGAFADIPMGPVIIEDPPCAFTPRPDPC